MPAAGSQARLFDALLGALRSLPSPTSGFLVALSGGRDSVVLLRATAEALPALAPGMSLRAVHVHHGLHPSADAWAGFCREICREWSIPIEICRVDATAPQGESPEGWARDCRYRALAEKMQAAETLLTAHHRRDQAETVLLQLLRGAGPSGLAGMPALRRFADGWHLRPLLAVEPTVLDAFAAERRLKWVDDPSNTDPRFDRNFLRHEILPRLEGRWPGAVRAVARAARWQAGVASGLAGQSAAALAAVASTDGRSLGVEGLLALPTDERANVLREWLHRNDRPVPSAAQLEQLLRMLSMRPDAVPCVRWADTEVRRYHGRLVVMSPVPVIVSDMQVDWQPAEGPLHLPLGTLSATAPAGMSLLVRYRRGGERCRMHAGGPTRPVKHLLQEWGIPAWLRPGLPLVYDGPALVAIGDRKTAIAASGFEPHWQWREDLGAPCG